MMVAMAMGKGKHCGNYASEPATGLSIRKSVIAVGGWQQFARLTFANSHSAIFIQ
jgi:hypothetical protein